MKRVSRLLWFLLVLFLFASGPGMAAADSGTIAPSGEYSSTATFDDGNLIVMWTIDGDTISIALVGKTEGWLALGIAPSGHMQDTDMLFGWVTPEGQAQVLDTYCTQQIGVHPADTGLGGTMDLFNLKGSQADGATIVEFQRKLETGDRFDHPIPRSGPLSIIWAYGSEDDINLKHTTRGYGTLDLGSGQGSERTVPLLWPIHAGLMLVGVGLTGYAIALLMRKKKPRGFLRIHQRFALAGGIVLLLGLAMAVIMVSITTGIHLRVLHAIGGVTAFVLTATVLVLGFAFLKSHKNKKKIRPLHLWLARLDCILLIGVIAVGFIQALS
ncbi:MAG: hypothetical protein NTU59_07415 [Coprothermobacterota bacterium]|nr:hypothetical protein [Coprothermobacterota bacterium]